MTTDITITPRSCRSENYENTSDATIYIAEDVNRKTRISVMSGREFTVTLADLIAMLRQREIATAQALARRDMPAAGRSIQSVFYRQGWKHVR